MKDQILQWIYENHDHHENADEDVAGCVDKDYPYVNSMELEKFIRSLPDF